MMAYAQLEDLRPMLGVEHVSDDDYLSLCLAVAHRGIDAMCRRTFDVPAEDATATTRVFVPLNCEVVYIDDLADPTGLVVTNDGASVSLSSIQYEPLNQLGTDRRYRPIEGLRLISGSWVKDGRRATVAVTSSRWGWTVLPDVAKQATLLAAKDLVNLREARFGTSGWGDIAIVRVRENPSVRMLLDPSFVRADSFPIGF